MSAFPARRLAALLTAAMTLAILIGTLTPGSEAAPRWPHLDKAAHFSAFLLLVLPLAVALPGLRPLWPVALAAIAFGGVIELVQPMVGRGAEWLDFWANAAGVAVGLALGRGLRRVWLRSGRPAA